MSEKFSCGTMNPKQIFKKPEGCLLPSLVETGSVFLENKILTLLHFALEKGMALHLSNFDFLSPKDALCQKQRNKKKPL